MKHGFTLIELLMVIAIVLILAGLLVAGLAKLWPFVHGSQAEATLNMVAAGATRDKTDHSMAHKPFAWYLNTAGLADRAHPTLAELRARAALFNPAVEFCPKRVHSELVLGAPDQWPCVNARLRSKDLVATDPANYEFVTYFAPQGKDLKEVAPGVSRLVDPWGRPYQYLIFEEDQDVVQADKITVLKQPVFIELLASPGRDGQLNSAMPALTGPGGFTDATTHPENEDNIFVEVDRWSP